MTEADGLRTEINTVEADLDEIINRVAAVSHLVETMEERLLLMELYGSLSVRVGVGMLETIRNSAEFILQQGFVFRNELRDYKDRL